MRKPCLANAVFLLTRRSIIPPDRGDSIIWIKMPRLSRIPAGYSQDMCLLTTIGKDCVWMSTKWNERPPKKWIGNERPPRITTPGRLTFKCPGALRGNTASKIITSDYRNQQETQSYLILWYSISTFVWVLMFLLWSIFVSICVYVLVFVYRYSYVYMCT